MMMMVMMVMGVLMMMTMMMIDSNGNHVDDGDYNIIDNASTSQVRARELFGEQWFLVDDHKDYDNLKGDENLKKL